MLNNSELFQTKSNTGLRDRNIDVYKGVLIFFVVIRHILQYSVNDQGGILTNYIWAIQMPGFMIVAGYFSAREIVGIKNLIRRFLLSIQHYALPFLSWFVLIDVLLLGSHSHNPLSGLLYLIFHVDSGLWFLWVVFVLSIIFSLANFMLSSKKHKIFRTAIVLLVVFSILLLLAYYFSLSFFGIKYVLYYSIFYGFGWLVNISNKLVRKLWPKIEMIVVFFCFVAFITIVFNFDLYNMDDRLINIIVRCIAGFSGNAVLFSLCKYYVDVFCKIKVDFIGLFTLEIYVTHVYVNRLFSIGEGFFTLFGFINFVCSLLVTVIFSLIIIMAFKSNKITSFIFFGKR